MEITLQTKVRFPLESLYDDDFFTDCVVKSANGQEFKAHRNILAKRSDFFDAMLRSDMKEGISKVIELPETSEIVNLLLLLIYGQECKGTYKEFMELALATEKYLMKEDYAECVQKLMTAINLTSAVEILIFALENNIDALKEKALDYIIKNFKEIRASQSWDFLVDRPEYLAIAYDGYIEHTESLLKAKDQPLPQNNPQRGIFNLSNRDREKLALEYQKYFTARKYNYP